MKLVVLEWLKSQGYQITNFGTDSIDSMDYPDVVHPLAEVIENVEIDLGVLIF